MTIDLIDDNEPVLLLDGVRREVDFSTTFVEQQPYLPDNPRGIVLSNNLTIEDFDVGPQFLVKANVTTQGAKSIASCLAKRH